MSDEELPFVCRRGSTIGVMSGLPEYGYTFKKPWNQRKQGCKPLPGDIDGQLMEQRSMSSALLGALDIELEPVCLVLRRISAAAVISWAATLAHSSEVNASIETLLAALHPGSNIEKTATGDLDNDGVKDIAYLVRWPQSDEYAVGILRGQEGGVFAHWEKSRRLEMTQRLPEVEMRRGSLYVSYMRNGMAWGRWRTLEYSVRASHLVLIGEEEYFRSPRLEIEPGLVRTERISTNYLNCREIKSTTEDRKRTEVKSKLHGCRLASLDELE